MYNGHYVLLFVHVTVICREHGPIHQHVFYTCIEISRLFLFNVNSFFTVFSPLQ